jgi:hypothetical protein
MIFNVSGLDDLKQGKKNSRTSGMEAGEARKQSRKIHGGNRIWD